MRYFSVIIMLIGIMGIGAVIGSCNIEGRAHEETSQNVARRPTARAVELKYIYDEAHDVAIYILNSGVSTSIAVLPASQIIDPFAPMRLMEER